MTPWMKQEKPRYVVTPRIKQDKLCFDMREIARKASYIVDTTARMKRDKPLCHDFLDEKRKATMGQPWMKQEKLCYDKTEDARKVCIYVMISWMKQEIVCYDKTEQTREPSML